MNKADNPFRKAMASGAVAAPAVKTVVAPVAPAPQPQPAVQEPAVDARKDERKAKAKESGIERKAKAKPVPSVALDKETWEGLLNCVYVTKHKSNRYFIEHAKRVATARSKCKKAGVPFDLAMIPTTPVIRDIRRSLAFLAKTRPKDAEGVVEPFTDEVADE